MGVYKLTTWLEERNFFKRTNLSGKRLIIDGCSLCFHISKHCPPTSYEAIYIETCKLVKQFNVHKIKFEVWFDVSTAKDFTKKSEEYGRRQDQKARAICNLVNSWEDGVNIFPQNLKLPLASLQVIMALRECKVTIKSTNGEADMTMGRRVKAGRAYAVLSNDSDFATFEGCRWVKLDTFQVPNGDLVQNKTIKKELGLTLKQWEMFVILLGNDYTKYLKSMFRPFGRRSHPNPNKILEYIRSNNLELIKTDPSYKNWKTGLDFIRCEDPPRVLARGGSSSTVLRMQKDGHVKSSHFWAVDKGTWDVLKPLYRILVSGTKRATVQVGQEIVKSEIKIRRKFAKKMQPWEILDIGTTPLSVAEATRAYMCSLPMIEKTELALAVARPTTRNHILLRCWCELAYVRIHDIYNRCNCEKTGQPYELFEDGGTMFCKIEKTLPKKESKESEKSQKSLVLPIIKHMKSILAEIKEHQITIVCGETGCGKSSQIPINVQKNNPNARVLVTQPRRFAAMQLAERVADNGKLGGLVGYRVGFGTRQESKSTRLWYVTTGYLAEYLLHCNGRIPWTHIFLDEIHERSLDMDLCLLLIKRLLTNYPHIKLVVMSATVDLGVISGYFGNNVHVVDAISKMCHPVQIKYLDDLTENSIQHLIPRLKRMNDRVPTSFMRAQSRLALTLVRRKTKPGETVLIFLDGMASIEGLYYDFQAYAERYHCVVLHSSMSNSDVDNQGNNHNLFEFPDGKTLVVLATDIAETSVTIPDVSLVIDTAVHKRPQENQFGGQLLTEWISKTSLTQRAGRTGRTCPGTVWRLIPRQLYDMLSQFDTPESKRIPTTAVILRLKHSLVDAPVTPIINDLLNGPDSRSIANGLQTLFDQKIVESAIDGAPFTPSGKVLSKLPLSTMGRLVINRGIQLGCIGNAVLVAVALSTEKYPFVHPHPLLSKTSTNFNRLVRTVLKTKHEFMGESYSDIWMLCQLYRAYRKVPRAKQRHWLGQRGIVVSTMRMFVQKVKNTAKILSAELGGKMDMDAQLDWFRHCPKSVEPPLWDIHAFRTFLAIIHDPRQYLYSKNYPWKKVMLRFPEPIQNIPDTIKQLEHETGCCLDGVDVSVNGTTMILKEQVKSESYMPEWAWVLNLFGNFRHDHVNRALRVNEQVVSVSGNYIRWHSAMQPVLLARLAVAGNPLRQARGKQYWALGHNQMTVNNRVHVGGLTVLPWKWKCLKWWTQLHKGYLSKGDDADIQAQFANLVNSSSLDTYPNLFEQLQKKSLNE